MEMKTLGETTAYMESANYKERFYGEYWQAKIRHDSLKRFCNNIEAAQLTGKYEEPRHDCPLELLRKQQAIMEQYLSVLELRASIEGVSLK